MAHGAKRIRKIPAVSLSLFYAMPLALCTLLFSSGCQSQAAKGELHAVDSESLFAKPIQTLAVLPIQNTTGRHTVLYTGRGSLIQRTVTALFEGKKLSNQKGGNVANPLYVEEVLNKGLTAKLKRKGYQTLRPGFVEKEYFRIDHQKRDVTPFELSLSIPADAFLMVTLNDWDSERFIPDGWVTAAFDLVLIRASDGAMLWSKKIPKNRYALQVSPNDTVLVHKRQEELMDLIAVQILNGFPKPSILNAAVKK